MPWHRLSVSTPARASIAKARNGSARGREGLGLEPVAQCWPAKILRNLAENR